MLVEGGKGDEEGHWNRWLVQGVASALLLWKENVTRVGEEADYIHDRLRGNQAS